MRAPGFWWRKEPGPPARLLAPLGALVGAVAARRMRRSGAAASRPVLCVGNPVAGGAGKTPTAIALARMLAASGAHPVFLTRGYGGREAGPLRVDPDRHRAADVGDEPLLLAAEHPTVVARDRVAGAALAAMLGDVIVMDDGFQNPALAKNLSVLVVDGAVGIGNGLCLPAGPLRAPLAAQLAQADALVVIGEGPAGDAIAAAAARHGLPVRRARLVPRPESAARICGRRVLAFAGIGRPEKFTESLAGAGAEVVRSVPFPDHHAFTAAEAEELLAAAAQGDLTLVTTAKDRARLSGRTEPALSRLFRDAGVLEVDLAFDDPAAVSQWLAALNAPAR